MQGPPAGSSALSPEAVAAFKEQLGINDDEHAHFGWIAEVGLQSPLPPRWTSHADEQSGFIYYVDHDRQTSTWENPLVPHLRRVVELGRSYLQNPTHGYFEEQKGILWHQQKHALDCWHGPFTDAEGRKYFVNAVEQVSSWEDPRVDAQYIFELESGLLTSLEDVLPVPPGEDPWLAENGAEVLTLGGIDEASPSSGSPFANTLGSTRGRLTNGWRKGGTMSTTFTGGVSDIKTFAQMTAKKEHTTTLEKMGSVASKVQGLQQDDEEAQRLALARAVEQRRRRRQLQQAGTGATPGSSHTEVPPPPMDAAPPLPSRVPISPACSPNAARAPTGGLLKDYAEPEGPERSAAEPRPPPVVA